jgi:hypothetical protein
MRMVGMKKVGVIRLVLVQVTSYFFTQLVITPLSFDVD